MAKGFTLLSLVVAIHLVAGQYRTTTRRDGFSLPDNLPRRRPLPEEYLLEEEPVRSRAQDDDGLRRRQPQGRRQLPPDDVVEEPRVSRRRTSAAALPLPVQPAELVPPPPSSQRRSDGGRPSRRQRQRGTNRRRQRPQIQDDSLEDSQDNTQSLPPQRQVDSSFALDPRLLRQPLLPESSPNDPGQPLSVDQILGRDTLTLDPPQGQLQPIDGTPQRPTEVPTRRPTLPVDLPSHGGQPLSVEPGPIRSQFQPVDFQAHARHSSADPPTPRRQPSLSDPRLQRQPPSVDPSPRRQTAAVDTTSSRRQLPAEPPSRRQPDPPAPRRQSLPPPAHPPAAQPRRPPPQPRRPPPAVSVPLPSVDRQCETPNGFFPDEQQCDRYYECRNGVATEGLCPDGLVFNTAGGARYLNCDSPRVVDCTGRAELQPAQPNGNCPRRYGMFAHESDCTRFWNCLDGHGTEIQCPQGLVYNIEKATCDWPDNVPRCNVEEQLDFTCPETPEEGQRQGVYLRYAHPTDCRLHYVCIPGKDGVSRPRLQSCPDKLVFDNIGGFCEFPRTVEGCEDYYGDSEQTAAREDVRPAAEGQSRRRNRRTSTGKN